MKFLKMKFSSKTSGILTMIGVPFLFIQISANSKSGVGHPATGMCDLFYITGWLCCLIGLMNLEAIGNKKWGENLLSLSFVLLSMACIGNIWKAMDPNNPWYSEWWIADGLKRTF